ncbi:MAG: T9SS type A sorting domain-containing protein [Bacteroidota bacterium]
MKQRITQKKPFYISMLILFGFALNFTMDAQAVIRVARVDTDANEITLMNMGNATLDIDDYWLCLGPGTYVRVGNAANGSTNLDPNSSVVVSYNVDAAADGFSLFSTNIFGSSDPEILIDYVQWGAANQSRVGQAVSAGRWDSANNFLNGSSPYNFTGTATDFGSTFWETTLGIDEFLKGNVNIYPNPITSIVNLQIDDQILGAMSLQITDLSGRLVSTSEVRGGMNNEINLDNIENGIYMLTIYVGASAVLSQKVVKQ